MECTFKTALNAVRNVNILPSLRLQVMTGPLCNNAVSTVPHLAAGNPSRRDFMKNGIFKISKNKLPSRDKLEKI